MDVAAGNVAPCWRSEEEVIDVAMNDAVPCPVFPRYPRVDFWS